MSRLVIPEDFNGQVTLLSNIIVKNNADDKVNPLAAFLTQQNINLKDDANTASSAQAHDFTHLLQAKQSENYRQLRENNFAAPWQHLTGAVQFLKSFFTGNTKELGNWGITISDSGKVNYPPAFSDRAAVFNAFAEKHNSYEPGQSPLTAFLNQQDINLAADTGLVAKAIENDAAFTAAAQQSENETELRNKIWQPVLARIRAIGNFLMKLYMHNLKALGAWGFVVDDSAQQPRLRTTKLKLGEKITTNGIILGSVLTNLGKADLHVYKGKLMDGAMAVVHAGEQFGIQKGFSSITVANPSTAEEGVFSVMVRQ